MYGIAVMLVLSSGFLHSIWNLYTKRSVNKNVFLWFCHLISIVVFLPWTLLEWKTFEISSTGLLVVAASVLIHGLYMVLLAAAYSIGDLSQVYPIMRGTSPLLVPVAGVLIFNESLSVYGWAGVACIVCGIVLLSNITFKSSSITSFKDFKAPLLALAVGICIASYIIVDKIALNHVSAVVLIQATNVGNVLALSWAALSSRGLKKEWAINWKVTILGGVIAPGGYLLFLLALSLAPVAQLAPMREIGTVFGTIMGIFILREKQGIRRIFTSLLITIGVVILGVWG
ncbi:DMT family transporter [Paenibacillus eucommiae]|uniref:Membrane protein n=1 Tax=Paenibacillus eucommiae TaxID=1355755 RepID=A0ABS4IS06_9BACL|nr:DMT family transporter [Paenibacillus eucommiae]MBP1990351.1 putative membrane protein [Paenibacillus eucommiae]